MTADLIDDFRLTRGTRSLTDQAYAALRRAILTCRIPPGHEISELDLAERLGMSKTPVREALGRLGVEGLVETFPRRGYRVTPVTVRAMNDLFSIRSALEGQAGALAARNMSDEEILRIERAAERPAETLPGPDAIALNHAFHAAIAAGSGNSRLHALVLTYLDESERFLHIGARTQTLRLKAGSDHPRIAAALRARDPEAARRCMTEHTENTRAGLLHTLVTTEAALLVL